MFDDAAKFYESIGNALSNAAVNPWNLIVLNATLDDVRVDVIVSCWRTGQSEVEYLTGVPRLASFIYDLARVLSTPEKGRFKKCKFTLQNTGKFDVEFEY
ncbi:immunity protein YezG family protein [Herbaspirillum rubrisubalbicans]|uniref:Uncharacterized protein n=1 Tax=Herbaspirillum rubrisubalbicans TaxID=80842 RepID=A0ABX9C023_9BURK|nr:immunity protein YezG family protein [Herbaspirillum rubrisubalbicans]RAM63626.1 hypothetical protein RB24_16280 [Herbaspirillum rubrisubalbicans]